MDGRAGPGQLTGENAATLDYSRVLVGANAIHTCMAIIFEAEAAGHDDAAQADAVTAAIAAGLVGVSPDQADTLSADELDTRCSFDTYLANVEARRVAARMTQVLKRPIVTICLARPRETHRAPRRATTRKPASKGDNSDPPGQPPAPSHDGLERLGRILDRLVAVYEERARRTLATRR